MKLTHINCKDTNCPICFQDAQKLEDYLTEKTGNDKVDHLGKYHKWLSDNGINPETEWGWFTLETFDDKNIEGYIKDFKVINQGSE